MAAGPTQTDPLEQSIRTCKPEPCWRACISWQHALEPEQLSLGVRARRYYSLFTLGMLVMFECTVVGQRLRNLRELRSLTVPKQALQVGP